MISKASYYIFLFPYDAIEMQKNTTKTHKLSRKKEIKSLFVEQREDTSICTSTITWFSRDTEPSLTL